MVRVNFNWWIINALWRFERQDGSYARFEMQMKVQSVEKSMLEKYKQACSVVPTTANLAKVFA